jgi:hypothetical protein
MRKIIILVGLLVCFTSHSQIYIEYISEPTDSMALISKEDIDIINKTFNEKSTLDSLNTINEELISTLKLNNRIQCSILEKQDSIIKNKELIIKDLELKNDNNIKYYSKQLKNERNKKISFQATTSVGIIVIILLLLL